jgi:hypothetical protein
MTNASSTTVVETMLYQLDSAFEGEHWHSLLRNLRSTTVDDWDWVPPGGRRTIREIVHHVGICKLMFANHTFGDRSLKWEDLEGDEYEPVRGDVDDVIAWLREAQVGFRAGIASVVDAELPETRQGYWDDPRELRWSIEVLIQHDVYHAGEINEIRALHQGNDA